MAELVDAPDSKSGIRKDVQVRFLFRAHHSKATKTCLAGLCCFKAIGLYKNFHCLLRYIISPGIFKLHQSNIIETVAAKTFFNVQSGILMFYCYRLKL